MIQPIGALAIAPLLNALASITLAKNSPAGTVRGSGLPQKIGCASLHSGKMRCR